MLKPDEQKQFKKIAEMLLPKSLPDIKSIMEKYPERNLPKEAMVTRIAPSPTGFMHIGSVYTALISERLAHQSKGIFYLRIEDTDKKREVQGAKKMIIESLHKFGINIDEGEDLDGKEKGEYGPYCQSDRKEIYHAFIKYLIEIGRAYPCFCKEEELESMRQAQEEVKIKPGYYGTWAKWRDAKIELIEEMLKRGEPYVIRFRSLGNETRNFMHYDLLKGDIIFPENDIDIIIMKTDGLPTYHLAHVIDDYLMRTSHVFRGDEWVSSIPLHYELFKAFDFKIPFYGHIAPISKIDENGGKRKLSKRKDPEANISFYEEKGYPNVAVIEYLINLVNSNFEDWRKENPNKSYKDFQLDLGKFSKSAGPLLDKVKLKDVAKGIVAKMSPKEMYKNAVEWAKKYDVALRDILKDQSYWEKIFSMEKDAKNPRKDISCWSEIKNEFSYFIPGKTVKPDWSVFSCVLNTEEIKETINSFKEVYKITDSSEEWMKKIAKISSKFNLAPDIKTYKKNKDNYRGHIGEVAQVIRYAITGETKTPDLYQIMQILGEEESKNRLVC